MKKYLLKILYTSLVLQVMTLTMSSLAFAANNVLNSTPSINDKVGISTTTNKSTLDTTQPPAPYKQYENQYLNTPNATTMLKQSQALTQKGSIQNKKIEPPKVEYITKVNDIADTLRGLAIGLIVVSALFTSIMYMMNSISPGAKEMGKKALYSLILGVVMLALYKDISKWVADFALLNNSKYHSADDLPTAMGSGIKFTNDPNAINKVPEGATITIKKNYTMPDQEDAKKAEEAKKAAEKK